MGTMMDSEWWTRADTQTQSIAEDLSKKILDTPPLDANVGQIMIAQILALLAYLDAAHRENAQLPFSCKLLELAAAVAIEDLLFAYMVTDHVEH